jgi:hypothetical protein
MSVTPKNTLAALFFLLAVQIASCAFMYKYIESKYPTSISFIQQNLRSSEVTDQFKVNEAKSAGYSEQEISQYLAETNKALFEKNVHNLFFVEVIVFFVCFFVGLGLIILKQKPKT